ncbi:hypothetical protein LINGRAHAP2_LOCUS2935 [Linum grandiflorum]
MKLWVRLEFVPDDLRTPTFASSFLGLIGEVLDAGMFSSPEQSGYFLRGFVRLDVLRPFYGRRKARDENDAEFWVRLQYEGIPPLCFRCGRMGHNHGRCPDAPTPLNLEDRGPWISLPTGVYRRVNAFTFQPDDLPRQRLRDGISQHRSLNLLDTSADSRRSAPLRQPPSNSPLPRPVTRSDASLGLVPRTRLNRESSSRREVMRPSTSSGKRPLMLPEVPPRRKDARDSPSSPDSVGSSSAFLPPGFGVGETSRPPTGWVLRIFFRVSSFSSFPKFPLIILSCVSGPLEEEIMGCPLLGPNLAPGPSSWALVTCSGFHLTPIILRWVHHYICPYLCLFWLGGWLGEVAIKLGIQPVGDGVSDAANQPAPGLEDASSGAAPLGHATSQVVSGADLDRPAPVP